MKKLVFSALEDVTKATNGRLTRVAHFDGKGHLEAYIKEQGIPAVFVLLAAYMQNWLGFFKPKKDEAGEWAITLPDMGDSPYNQVRACVRATAPCVRICVVNCKAVMFVRTHHFPFPSRIPGRRQ